MLIPLIFYKTHWHEPGGPLQEGTLESLVQNPMAINLSAGGVVNYTSYMSHRML